MTKKIKPGFENGIIDNLSYKLEDISINKDKFKELNDSLADSEKTALRITVDASHGGYINGNYRFYKFGDLRDGAESMTKPLPIPFLELIHGEGKPIGRVESAEFIPLVDNALANTPTCKIRVTALITDQDSIEKILDKRYLSVSTGAKAVNGMECSICGEDITDWQKCPHTPGNKYEDKLCYAISKGLEYKEVTIVNIPGDISKEHFAGITSASLVSIPQSLVTSINESIKPGKTDIKDNLSEEEIKKNGENMKIEDELKESKVKIASLEETLKEVNDKLSTVEGSVKEKDAKITELSDSIVKKDEEITNLKTSITANEELISKKDAEAKTLKDHASLMEANYKAALVDVLVEKEIAYRKDITKTISDCATIEDKEKVIQKQVDDYLKLSLVDIQAKIKELEKDRPVDFLNDITSAPKKTNSTEEKTKKYTSRNPGLQAIFDAHLNKEEK